MASPEETKPNSNSTEEKNDGQRQGLRCLGGYAPELRGPFGGVRKRFRVPPPQPDQTEPVPVKETK